MMSLLLLSIAFWLVLAIFGVTALRVLLTGAAIGLRGVARCGLCFTPIIAHRPVKCSSCNCPTDRAGIITPLSLARGVSWTEMICASIFLGIVAFAFPFNMLMSLGSRSDRPDSLGGYESGYLLMQYALAAMALVICVGVCVRRHRILHTKSDDVETDVR